MVPGSPPHLNAFLQASRDDSPAANPVRANPVRGDIAPSTVSTIQFLWIDLLPNQKSSIANLLPNHSITSRKPVRS
jgi:hypothetical protein